MKRELRGSGGDGAASETPSTNHQSPVNAQAPIPNPALARIWGLKLGDSLGIGDWRLGFLTPGYIAKSRLTFRVSRFTPHGVPDRRTPNPSAPHSPMDEKLTHRIPG